MHDKHSMLRKLALQAKQRLNGASIEKETCTKKELTTVAIYKNLYKNNFKIITYVDNEKEFCEKVKNLMNSCPDSPNILKLLVEQDIYKQLNDEEKMAYMLNLAERYAKTKTKIINEKFKNEELNEMSI